MSSRDIVLSENDKLKCVGICHDLGRLDYDDCADMYDEDGEPTEIQRLIIAARKLTKLPEPHEIAIAALAKWEASRGRKLHTAEERELIRAVRALK